MPIFILTLLFCLNGYSKDTCTTVENLKKEVPPNIYYGCVKEKCSSDCGKDNICSCECLIYGCLQRNVNSQSRAVASFQAIKNKNNTMSCVPKIKYQNLMAKNQKCKK